MINRSVDSVATSIIALLSAQRIDLTDEKEAQRQIGEILDLGGHPHDREVRLSRGDVVDFLVKPEGIAIEVKLRTTGKMAVYRQMERYAEHAPVRALLLVTAKSMGLPAEIGGKPAFYASLARAWL